MAGFAILGTTERIFTVGVPQASHGRIHSEWYLEKRGSRKILAGSRNLGSVFDKSRSFVFSWVVFTFFSLENFHQRVSGSDF